MLTGKIQQLVEQLDYRSISEERKQALAPLIDYLGEKLSKDKAIQLNFICTHNSRRSQMAQIWAKVAAYTNGIKIISYSGGMEVTAFHPNAVKAMNEQGFEIETDSTEKENPIYSLRFSSSVEEMKLFSKKYDDSINPSQDFAAVMTCSQADETCPFVLGMNKRISLPYEDPKAFDGQDNCISKYKERSLQIARELFYVFNQINKREK